MPPKGTTMLYRPVPRDFPEKFVQVGWRGIEKEFHAHAKTIRRWMEICGYDSLRAQRAAFVAQQDAERRERMNGTAMNGKQMNGTSG